MSTEATRARVTQTDIARVAGVHNTTVSLALRNSPSIPEATRQRIRAIAAQLGYYPDPALQALVAYRKSRMPTHTKETLAWITHGETRWGWRQVHAHEQSFIGAQQKATELGYQIEHFWLGEPNLTPQRLSSMLFHRGITGVVLAAQRETVSDLSALDWSRLSAVRIGCHPHDPALHGIANDCPNMARLAVRRVRAAGYRRVGLVMTSWWDDAVDQGWSAGYLLEQGRAPTSHRVPILRLGGSRSDWLASQPALVGTKESGLLGQWIREHNPDAVLAFSPRVQPLIQQLGLTVGRDLAYADLALEQTDGTIAGLCQHHKQVGELAINDLVLQLQKNVLGVQEIPTTTMVGGAWIDGATLRANSVLSFNDEQSRDMCAVSA